MQQFCSLGISKYMKLHNFVITVPHLSVLRAHETKNSNWNLIV